MPPRKRPGTKLSPAQERSLVKDYGIQFEGPVLRSQWPSQYNAIYQTIQSIESVKYSEYVERKPSCSWERIRQIKTLNRVHALVRNAFDCRKASLNEDEWRRSTEAHVLRHFDDELECPTCRNRLSIAEFRGVLGEPTRTMCTCNPNETLRVEVSSNTGRPFLMRRGMPAVDESGPVEIGERKPDAIIGIQGNDRIGEILRRLDGIRCSTVQDDLEMLFPFLVLEAKSEVAGPGFQSVEIQTAFPIRALLNIQKSLNEHTKIRRNPLLWFIAFKGDIWKVYGCTPEDRKTKVIQLWHGTILRHDCALQLYLIIDFIYDWAVEVYREEILHCLSPGQVTALGDDRSAEGTIQQVNELYYNNAPSMIVDGSGVCLNEQHDLPPSSDPTLRADVISLSSESSGDMEMMDTNLAVNDETELPVTTEYRRDVSGDAVIRNADEVFFTFHHLMLPETQAEMISILTSVQPNDSIVAAAQHLLNLIGIEEPLVVNGEILSQMEEMWTGSSRRPSPYLSGPILALISFRTYFRPTDWQLLRDISCITASTDAINMLGSIAFDGYDSVVDPSELEISGLTGDAMRPLRAVWGHESTAIAAKDLCLSLEKRALGYDWVTAPEGARYMTQHLQNSRERDLFSKSTEYEPSELKQNNTERRRADSEETALLVPAMPKVLPYGL
ncbi:hypothetical protein FE257_008809 [Aspergillus nanangensis]|uniref:Uncharacterized protein n=1 Tax=Aspergillus nanangensis TaxID=2582783 RepID=A0AAD4CKK7_ASPNN|nr:hypothetical protein FE257_008809 [Aspergillus nanangensis]